MAQTADIHDALVEILTDMGIPDLIANYPTMIPSYAAACLYNNLSEHKDSRDYFILFEIRW